MEDKYKSTLDLYYEALNKGIIDIDGQKSKEAQREIEHIENKSTCFVHFNNSVFLAKVIPDSNSNRFIGNNTCYKIIFKLHFIYSV